MNEAASACWVDRPALFPSCISEFSVVTSRTPEVRSDAYTPREHYRLVQQSERFLARRDARLTDSQGPRCALGATGYVDDGVGRSLFHTESTWRTNQRKMGPVGPLICSAP